MTGVLISILVAGTFGFASRRGRLCVISGITAAMEKRSPRVFLSFANCSLWAACCIWPLWWLVPRTHVAQPYPIALATVLGGVVFGTGAAINSGCFFGTLTRLATGDLSYLATFGGVALGADLERRLSWIMDAPDPMGESLVARPSVTGVVLLSLGVVLCLRQLPYLIGPGRESRDAAGAAFPIGGLSGGVLFALHGAWLYPLAGDWDKAPATIATLSLSSLGGAVLASACERSFALRVAWRSIPVRLIGGAGMGFGSALTPGGNTTLILQAAPALSPHAFVAYVALASSAAIVLARCPRLRRLARMT